VVPRRTLEEASKRKGELNNPEENFISNRRRVCGGKDDAPARNCRFETRTKRIWRRMILRRCAIRK
jgi:hypothetical protein